MRAIRKAREPLSLTEHRAGSFADFNNYKDKEGLRASLVREQRGLCCYCLSRIRPHGASMKIEHWRCQARYPEEQLTYSNLLAACTGIEGHCDTRKGDRDLSRNPANPAHAIEEFIHFKGDGRISSDDPGFNEELDEVLNLNVAFLVNNRRETLRAFTAAFQTPGELSRPSLESLLDKWSGESHTNELEPYCQIVVYWLRKRLRRAR
jgi:uncharacterized protein (TIGR02646 family)